MTMDEERRRILRMLAEGSISVEECEELLKALSERRTEKVAREVESVQGDRPVWPYILLVGLAVVGVVMWVGLGSLFAYRHGPPSSWVGPWAFPGNIVRGFRFGFPLIVFGGLMKTAALVFWIWMLVECIARLPCDFRLLFTSRHEYDKWIWIAVIVVTNWVGALAYLVLIRQEARARAGGVAPQVPPPEEPFTPSPRARSVFPFFLIGCIIAMCGVVAVSLLIWHPWTNRPLEVFSGPHGAWVPTLGLGLIVPFIVIVIWLGIFWVWMLIDCLARDHREFGTLITSDKSIDKILWLLLILFMSVIGAFAYHIAVRRRPRPTPAAVVKADVGRR